jgi:hypothetical protein
LLAGPQPCQVAWIIVLPRTRLYNAELGNGFAARYKVPVVRTALVIRVPSGSASHDQAYGHAAGKAR